MSYRQVRAAFFESMNDDDKLRFAIFEFLQELEIKIDKIEERLDKIDE